MSRNFKRFKEYYLSESKNLPNRVHKYEHGGNLFENTGGKEESYRTIAFKLAEIFSLYGFFFAQKKGFIKPEGWKKMMTAIINIPDPDEKWKKAVSLSKFLQQKTASPNLEPTPGEFGYGGQYSYGQETEDLPRATEYLQTASKASLETFDAAEKSKAMGILNQTLASLEPFSLVKESLLVLEKKYATVPTTVDLIRTAEGIGSRLLTIYDDMEAVKAAFPGSSDKIEQFLTGTVIPAVNELKNMIQNDIPKLGTLATEGYLKKLQAFDKKVDTIFQTSQTLRNQTSKEFLPNYASKQYEDSAKAIIDKVKQRIRAQGLQNARWIKAGDVFAGTTDINDPRYSGDAQASPQLQRKNIEEFREKQRSKGQDLAKHLAKKYKI